MNLKKWKIISIFLIFGLSGLSHFIYDWFPNPLTSLIFPVNESIWEHNKIIIFSFLIIALLEKCYYKNSKNTLYAGILSALLCSILVMLIFTPVYFYILKLNDNIFVTFIIFFICIALSVWFNYKLLNQSYNSNKEKIAIILWLITFIINGILTYYPLHISLFYDFNKNIYGR